MSAAKQTTLFRGIYEFEDPSGCLLAAKVPAAGTADLYDGTAVIVKPSQQALFIYKGRIADILRSGTHQIKTENVPILTKLANWKFGFKSPLRCELVFFAVNDFTSRRWGTPQPMLLTLEGLGAVPIRSFGHFTVAITDPKLFFEKLVGTRTTFSITELEEFVQGQIVELLPDVLSSVKSLDQLGKSYNGLSQILARNLNAELQDYGVTCKNIQILSALPSKEVLEAIDAKTAIQVIGSQREYLLYKAASSLGEAQAGPSNDPLQMMMGLMLGKGLIGAEYHEKENKMIEVQVACGSCGQRNASGANFCSKCGKKVAP